MMLTVLWACVYGSTIFTPPLLDDADSVHAEVAREMLVGGDWVTLHANGIRYLEKAPLLYWMAAGSFRLFGIHDWSARLPLVLGVLVLIGSVFFIGKHMFSLDAGFYAALASGFAFGPYIFTRFLIPDILVSLWFILSLGFFLLTFESPKPPSWVCWGFAASCALNVLTKGLIGLVFPAAVIGVYLLATGQLRHLTKMRIISSALLFLALSAPWHILAGLRNPTQGGVRGFFWFYFVNEHFLRYVNKRIPRDYDTVPLLLFWGLLIVWLFPWSTFLPAALRDVRLFRPGEWATSRDGRAASVFLLGALFVVLFFSFSSRQEYYVLPALPPLALLIGRWLAQEQASPTDSRVHRWGNVSSYMLGIAGVLTCALTTFLALASGPFVPGADIATLLHSGPAESQQYALSLGHFLDLNRRVMPMFRAPLILFGWSLLAGSVLNAYFRMRSRPALGNWSLAFSCVGLLIAVHMGLVRFSPILTSKPLADAISRVYTPEDIIELNGEYEGGASVSYYTRQQVRILNGRSANLWYGSQFPDAPQIFDDNAAFQQLWNGPRRIFLWTENEKMAKALEGIDSGSVFVLARNGGKCILTNRPVENVKQ
jgi:4-amino-4-deoxy-L-arabinose transferase-like glycosyltransferase